MVLRGGTDAMAADQLYDFLHPERHPDWVARYREQFQFVGTREALRRTRVAVAVAPQHGEHHPPPVVEPGPDLAEGEPVGHRPVEEHHRRACAEGAHCDVYAITGDRVLDDRFHRSSQGTRSVTHRV